MNVLASVKQHILDAGLASGYNWREGKLWASDSQSDERLILVRELGEGGSDPIYQVVNILVLVMGGSELDLDEIKDLSADITALFRSEQVQPGVNRFAVNGGKTGPYTFENNKPYYEIMIEAGVEDY